MSINRDQLARHYCKTVTAMAALLNRIGTASLPVERKISNTQYYNKQQAFEIIDAYLENGYKGSRGRPRTREQEVFCNTGVLHISRAVAVHCIKERSILREHKWGGLLEWYAETNAKDIKSLPLEADVMSVLQKVIYDIL